MAKANILYLRLAQASHRLIAGALDFLRPLTYGCTFTAFGSPLSEQSPLSENPFPVVKSLKLVERFAL